ncbi:MAG: amidase [Dehalococcoidia bacterium]|jgi:aspartyl-tRNA(Asn)/glutamyl-tRNA(Gln) amidotransferase subunit A
MSSDSQAYTSASELAEQIRSRQISPIEVIEAALRRIDTLQPTLNAFITVARDQAMDDARKAEGAIARGDDLGPLHGVPFSVKDLVNTRGVRTTMGSLIFEHNVPERDAIAVARLRAAGAIMIGKTTTPEFGHKPFTRAPLFGDTPNAWDRDRIAGGSSGGAAVAAAAGLAPLNVGTDGGGSIRIPAAANGIVGLKATLGTIPHDAAPDSFGANIYVGPMTRTVTDTALMLQAMAGPHPSDAHSLGRRRQDYVKAANAPGDLEGKKIAWRPLLGNDVIDSEVLAITHGAARAFEEVGATLIEVDDGFVTPEPFWRVLSQAAWRSRFGGYVDEWGDRMTPTFLRSITEASDYSADELQKAIYQRTELFREVQGWFDEFDLVMTPTLSRTALESDMDLCDPVVIEGREVGIIRQNWYPYTHPFNLTGHPAITLPAGFAGDGLPVALQIVGRYADDAAVIRAAALFEQLRPWADRTPDLPDLVGLDEEMDQKS